MDSSRSGPGAVEAWISLVSFMKCDWIMERFGWLQDSAVARVGSLAVAWVEGLAMAGLHIVLPYVQLGGSILRLALLRL